MSSKEARIVQAARAWARALAEKQAGQDGQVRRPAEIEMHRTAARDEALRSAERVLYQAVQLSREAARDQSSAVILRAGPKA
jgi:hypothetical protein